MLGIQQPIEWDIIKDKWNLRDSTTTFAEQSINKYDLPTNYEIDSLTIYLSGLREGVSMPSLLSIRDSYQVAESLARADLMTSPAARRRLQARRMELGLGEHPGYVPPKHLLLYLVRMGSFNSSPKILNEDIQDNDVILPDKMTKDELLNYCNKELNGTHELLNRSFRNLSIINNSKENLKAQEIFPVNDKASIRILQWNLLSQTLGLNNDNFIRCPAEALQWQRRKHLLIQEIVKYSPDLICLQEVDHFNYLRKSLSTQGYAGMFFPKPDSPCMYIKDNNGPDGCAIFFRTNRFQLIKCETRILEVWRVQSNQVAVLAIFRDLVNNTEISVATTHLKARQGALLAALRNEQGKDLLDFICTNCDDQHHQRPLIVCGDFNAEPVEPVYNTMLTHPQLNLASAYANYQNDCGEPPYTTWKVREEGEICHTIDYIFYSKDSYKVTSLLDFPTGEEIGDCRVPSYQYPSDHFSLVCDLLPIINNSSIQSTL